MDWREGERYAGENRSGESGMRMGSWEGIGARRAVAAESPQARSEAAGVRQALGSRSGRESFGRAGALRQGS